MSRQPATNEAVDGAGGHLQGAAGGHLQGAAGASEPGDRCLPSASPQPESSAT